MDFVIPFAALRLRACDGPFLFLDRTIDQPDETMIGPEPGDPLCVSVVNRPRRGSEDQLDHCSDAVIDLVGCFGDWCGFTCDDGIRIGCKLARQA